MVKQLGCCYCDIVCSECLFDFQICYDYDLLDCKVVLVWFGDDFMYYIGLLDEEIFLLLDVCYCFGVIGDMICWVINEGVEKFILWMIGVFNEWDLYVCQFCVVIQSYWLKDNVEVDFVIFVGVDDLDLLYELL